MNDYVILLNVPQNAASLARQPSTKAPSPTPCRTDPVNGGTPCNLINTVSDTRGCFPTETFRPHPTSAGILEQSGTPSVFHQRSPAGMGVLHRADVWSVFILYPLLCSLQFPNITDLYNYAERQRTPAHFS